jgi:hypothetical protein
MEGHIRRTIANLSTWDDLARFEANVRKKNRLSDGIIHAINSRIIELGRALVAEQTGIDLSNLSPAEEGIVRAVSEFAGIRKRQGKSSEYTFRLLRNRGLLGAAEAAVSKNGPTQGYQALADAHLENLSFEQIIANHEGEFSPRAVWFARQRLGLPNATASPPADTAGGTQTRTTELLQWLESLAQRNDGLMRPFTNTDAASILGMQDLQKYGRAYGNIQSRMDFACYLCGLPPIGLAADTPFANAWSRQNRAWAFPVKAMQAAARTHIWNTEDFNRIRRETERLPGQAHQLWKEALAKDEKKVKAWAFGFVESPPEMIGARTTARESAVLLGLAMN